jgi:hypothetical protein
MIAGRRLVYLEAIAGVVDFNVDLFNYKISVIDASGTGLSAPMKATLPNMPTTGNWPVCSGYIA